MLVSVSVSGVSVGVSVSVSVSITETTLCHFLKIINFVLAHFSP